MKPPKWSRDEIILALDLYNSLPQKEMDSKNPKVIELSKTLNKLPIHKEKSFGKKFRNPNGVGLKLSNFKAIDPEFPGKGMDRFSKLDKEIFLEFYGQKDLLKKIASQIIRTLSHQDTIEKLHRIPDEEDDEVLSVKEGRVIYKLHKLRERNSKINRKKKNRYLERYGRLDCEVCGFDFFKTYGELGKGFIEAHHRIPLSNLEGAAIIKLKDLALVCANCHRMLHREIDTITIEELKSRIKATAKKTKSLS